MNKLILLAVISLVLAGCNEDHYVLEKGPKGDRCRDAVTGLYVDSALCK